MSKNTYKIFISKAGQEIKVFYHAANATVVRQGKENLYLTFSQLDKFLENI